MFNVFLNIIFKIIDKGRVVKIILALKWKTLYLPLNDNFFFVSNISSVWQVLKNSIYKSIYECCNIYSTLCVKALNVTFVCFKACVDNNGHITLNIFNKCFTI